MHFITNFLIKTPQKTPQKGALSRVSFYNYTYSSWSDLTRIVLPDGKIQTITYDNLRRPLVITYSGQTITTNVYTGVLLNKSTYQNGKITNYTYDTLNRLSSIYAWSGISNPLYTYNDSSDILSDGTKSYAYDTARRLTTATPTLVGTSSESYSYDKTGNRTIGNINGNNTNYTTNILDQYTNLSGSTNTTNTYDNNGNLRSDSTNTYTYDYNNRLIQVNTWSGIIAQYQYDILGRRTKKVDTIKTESTIYVYNGDNIQSEYKTLWSGTGSLTLKKNYINGIWTDAILAYDVDESSNQSQISFCQNRVLPYQSEFTQYGYSNIVNDCNSIQSSGSSITTNRYYYHLNQLWSVIAISNQSGTVVQNYTYDSFGKAYIVTGNGTGTILTPVSSYAGNTYSNSRLYTGREYDKETNLYYLRARYYNTETGKFISRDPVRQSDQVNLYTYVANSPFMGTDRDGRKASQMIAKTWSLTKDFVWNEAWYISVWGYHLVDGMSFGYLDEYMEIQSGIDSTSYTNQNRWYSQWFNRWWKSGRDNAYLLDEAAVIATVGPLALRYAATKVPAILDGATSSAAIWSQSELIQLNMELAKQEAISNPNALQILWSNIGEPLAKWTSDWGKFAHNHVNLEWVKTEIHFMKNLVNWAIDQIKIK